MKITNVGFRWGAYRVDDIEIRPGETVDVPDRLAERILRDHAGALIAAETTTVATDVMVDEAPAWKRKKETKTKT